MSDSPLLGLPYLAASQAQKHVTLNDALSLVDGLLHLSVISRVVATPPVTPVDGDRYLIAAAATGDWLSHAGHVALRVAGAWRFLVPRNGWRIWIEAESIFLVFNGTSWSAPPPPASLQNLNLLGVNTAADATNKLAVSSASVLFNNVGNGVQFKINKAAATDTASLLLQTGFSGRAEIGTTGDDDLHLKVSANGSAFNESLIVSGATGKVTFKNTLALDPQVADPTTLSNGLLWYNSTTGKFRGQQNGASIDLISGGGAGVTDGDKGDITVSGAGSTWTIDATTITNLKLATVPTASFKGRLTAGVGAPEDLTATQATSLLDVATGTAKGLMAGADFTKLAGIAAGATANSTDATLLARANHTGTQSVTTITGLGLLATAASVNLSTQAAGTLQAAQFPAHTGDITNAAGSLATTIANNAVTNAKQAQMAAMTFKANNLTATANAADLTVDQMQAALNFNGLIAARTLIMN